MAIHNDLGKWGEKLAKNYLEQNGYEILDQNWVYEKSEIDIIAFKNGIMIFIEVKLRSSLSFGLPEEFVNDRKIKQLELASNEYIRLMNHQNEIRFDIISIIVDSKNNYTLKHIKDAFWPEN